MLNKPVYKAFFEAVGKMPLAQLDVDNLKSVFESSFLVTDDEDEIGFVDEDDDEEFENRLRDERTMYFIKRPLHNAMNLPQEITYQNIMNNVIDAIMDKANENPDVQPMFTYHDDMAALETIGFFITKLMKSDGSDPKRKRMCRGLVEAFYKYPLTAMAYKFSERDNGGEVSVGKSRNGEYIMFVDGIKCIVFRYIPFLCKRMDGVLKQFVLNPKPDEIACDYTLEPLDKHHQDGDATGVNNMLDALDKKIDSLESDEDIDKFFGLVQKVIEKCNTAHSLKAMLDLCASADDYFDRNGYSIESEPRLETIVALANKWKSRNWYVDISDDNYIEFHDDDTIRMFELSDDTVDAVREYTGLDRVVDGDVEHDNKKSYDSYDGSQYAGQNPYMDIEPVPFRKFDEQKRDFKPHFNEKKPFVEKPQKVLSPESEVKREAKRSMIPSVIEQMKQDGIQNIPDAAWITAVSKIISKYNHNANPIDSDEHINQVVNALENKSVPSEVFREMRRIKNAIVRNNNSHPHNNSFRPKRW